MEKKVVLVSHDGLAKGMLGAVHMIFGDYEGLYALGLEPDGSVAELGQKVCDIAMEDPDQQVIVIADLMGGSPCNNCVISLADLPCLPNVRIIAGMSLPLVISVISRDGKLTDEDLEECLDEAKTVTKIVEIPACKLNNKTEEDSEEDFF